MSFAQIDHSLYVLLGICRRILAIVGVLHLCCCSLCLNIYYCYFAWANRKNEPTRDEKLTKAGVTQCIERGEREDPNEYRIVKCTWETELCRKAKCSKSDTRMRRKLREVVPECPQKQKKETRLSEQTRLCFSYRVFESISEQAKKECIELSAASSHSATKSTSSIRIYVSLALYNRHSSLHSIPHRLFLAINSWLLSLLLCIHLLSTKLYHIYKQWNRGKTSRERHISRLDSFGWLRLERLRYKYGRLSKHIRYYCFRFLHFPTNSSEPTCVMWFLSTSFSSFNMHSWKFCISFCSVSIWNYAFPSHSSFHIYLQNTFVLGNRDLAWYTVYAQSPIHSADTNTCMTRFCSRVVGT